MKRTFAALTHATVAAAAGTGFAYGWMLYFAEPADEFALVNHPWQPAMHLLHVVAVPAFVFTLGLLWPTHIAPKLASRASARRRSGNWLVATVLPMIASGYAVQVSVAPEWRTAWAWVHGVTSVLFTSAFAVHIVRRSGHAASPSSRGDARGQSSSSS
jgi:hypothetical protein